MIAKDLLMGDLKRAGLTGQLFVITTLCASLSRDHGSDGSDHSVERHVEQLLTWARAREQGAENAWELVKTLKAAPEWQPDPEMEALFDLLYTFRSLYESQGGPDSGFRAAIEQLLRALERLSLSRYSSRYLVWAKDMQVELKQQAAQLESSDGSWAQRNGVRFWSRIDEGLALTIQELGSLDSDLTGLAKSAVEDFRLAAEAAAQPASIREAIEDLVQDEIRAARSRGRRPEADRAPANGLMDLYLDLLPPAPKLDLQTHRIDDAVLSRSKGLRSVLHLTDKAGRRYSEPDIISNHLQGLLDLTIRNWVDADHLSNALRELIRDFARSPHPEPSPGQLDLDKLLEPVADDYSAG
jgi:hypothetical protein